MILLCLSRILKTKIKFYQTNSQISESEIFSLISQKNLERVNTLINIIEMHHSFWSLQMTQISKIEVKPTDELILSTKPGYALVKESAKLYGTNILDNSDVSIDIHDVPDGSLYKVVVRDEVADINKLGKVQMKKIFFNVNILYRVMYLGGTFSMFCF